jgi:large subunit ribosomal protein L24|tara:strand:+ start:5600 stop:5917 length:318 start_codon:yes stop_codon:yes gene_type:complete
MAGLKIRKGDQVSVLTGKDKGKTGEVLRVLPQENRVIVRGVNLVKRHTRPTQTDAGGIKEQEASLHVSNVAHIDPSNGKPTRVGYKTVNDRKVRFSRRSGEVIDN